MESRAVYERNLAAIRKRSPQLANALEAASSESVEQVEGPRGDRVLKHEGVLLGSAYDPDRDAAQLAERMAEEPADLMVAVGFGLGNQFEAYCDSNPGTLIVYEPSVERLKAALELRSIRNLLSKNPDLYLASDIDQFSRLLEARYVSGIRIRIFPHPAIMRLDPEATRRAVERIARVKDATDMKSRTAVLQMVSWSNITAANGRAIAETPSFGVLMESFAGKPAVVVAAGPSLDKQLPLLREIRDQVVIIAIGQTLKSLRKAGIEPDLVHLLESRDVSHQLTDAGPTDDLNLVVTPDSHAACYALPVRSRFVATPHLSPMGKWIGSAVGETRFTMGGGTVAQGAVGLAVGMGANPILLIGQDLAFTEGRAYASGSAYDFVEVDVTEDGSCSFRNMKRKVGLIGDRNLDEVDDVLDTRGAIWVDGWEEGTRVPTWLAYASFIEHYREIGRYLSTVGVQLINCTEGGARIHGLEHRTLRDALDECTAGDLGASAEITRLHDAAPVHGLKTFAKAIQDARRRLADAEREARKGLRFHDRRASAISERASDQQKFEILRGLARHEKKIRRILDRVTWLDSLVQPEIQGAMIALRQTERQDPTLTELAEEARFLFEATLRGVERARDWFDVFEGSFDSKAKGQETARPKQLGEREAPVPNPGVYSPPTA